MIERIQHIGYLVADLDETVAWFEKTFGGKKVGGGPLAIGRNAILRFGQVEVDLIEPADNGNLPKDALTMHHVGYIVPDILKEIEELKVKGFKFVAESPSTNVMGQEVLMIDSTTTNGILVHLTENTPRSNTSDFGHGLPIDEIVHAGYLVEDLDSTIAWYLEKLDGVHVGGGATANGGRNAFVNFAQVQVELIEPGDKSTLGGKVQTMDHVGYAVADINSAILQCQNRGIRFVGDAPRTNSIGQQVLYFDTATSRGTRMHLTKLPD